MSLDFTIHFLFTICGYANILDQQICKMTRFFLYILVFKIGGIYFIILFTDNFNNDRLVLVKYENKEENWVEREYWFLHLLHVKMVV